MDLKLHKSKDEAFAANADKTVTGLLERALVHGASDIHIEPRARNIVVRFRVDGLLQEMAKLPLPALGVIAKNLKGRAGLKPAISGTPQRGSFQFDAERLTVDIQLTTMPTVTGEKFVLHLSRHMSETATLTDIGFWGDSLRATESTIADAHGLLIAVGPDRLGVTLSLLGMLHLLNNPALNIVTLEETVEHQLPGINQTQLNAGAGITFDTGLKALLNQDPNVVMVSDLHEVRAIRTAIQASLSGRLLLGGVHAGDAAHGVAQLSTLSQEPFLVASSLRLAVGQRFVRRLCEHCRQAYEPGEIVRKDLRHLLKACGVNSVSTLHGLEAAAIEAGLGDRTTSTTSKTITRLFRANPDGCPQCRFSGYHGRLGVCEALGVSTSTAMQKLIAGGGSATDIRKLAIADGMMPLPLDGLVKALRGLTSLEEVLPLALSV